MASVAEHPARAPPPPPPPTPRVAACFGTLVAAAFEKTAATTPRRCLTVSPSTADTATTKAATTAVAPAAAVAGLGMGEERPAATAMATAPSTMTPGFIGPRCRPLLQPPLRPAAAAWATAGATTRSKTRSVMHTAPTAMAPPPGKPRAARARTRGSAAPAVRNLQQRHRTMTALGAHPGLMEGRTRRREHWLGTARRRWWGKGRGLGESGRCRFARVGGEKGCPTGRPRPRRRRI